MSAFKSSSADTLSYPTDEIYVFLPDEYRVKLDDPNKAANKQTSNGGQTAPEESGAADATEAPALDPKQEPSTASEKIGSLVYSRTKVSTASREKLLQDIFLHYANKSSLETGVSDKDVDTLIKALKETRSEKEFYFAFKALVVISVLFVEDYGSVISAELFEIIKRKIKDYESVSPSTRSYLIIGYFTLFLVLNDGAHVAAIDEEISSWLSLLEVSSTNVAEDPDEVKTVVAILNGLAVLVSLIQDSVELNENIEALIPSIILYLNDENVRVSVAAGAIIAQGFQLYQYEEDFDEEVPYFDKDEIVEILTKHTKESFKKISKDDKKQLHVAFREVLATVEHNLSIAARNDFKESGQAAPLLYTFALNKVRKIPIHNWGYLVRLNHLRWAFGGGLATHMWNDSDLVAIIKDVPENYDKASGQIQHPELTETFQDAKQNYAASSEQKKKKDIQINKARLQKQHEHGLS